MATWPPDQVADMHAGRDGWVTHQDAAVPSGDTLPWAVGQVIGPHRDLRSDLHRVYHKLTGPAPEPQNWGGLAVAHAVKVRWTRRGMWVDAVLCELGGRKHRVYFDDEQKVGDVPVQQVRPLAKCEELPAGISPGRVVEADDRPQWCEAPRVTGWRRALLIGAWHAARRGRTRYWVQFVDTGENGWSWDVRSVLNGREQSALEFMLGQDHARHAELDAPWGELSVVERLNVLRRAGQDIKTPGVAMNALDLRLLHLLHGKGDWYQLSEGALSRIGGDDSYEDLRFAELVLEEQCQRYRSFERRGGLKALAQIASQARVTEHALVVYNAEPAEAIPVAKEACIDDLPECEVVHAIVLAEAALEVDGNAAGLDETDDETRSSDAGSGSEWDPEDTEDEGDEPICHSPHKRRRFDVTERQLTQSARGDLVLSQDMSRVPRLDERPLAILAAPAPPPRVWHPGPLKMNPEAMDIFRATLPGTPRHVAMRRLFGFFSPVHDRQANFELSEGYRGRAEAGKTSAIPRRTCLRQAIAVVLGLQASGG